MSSRNNFSEIGADVEIRKLKSLSPSHYAKLVQFLDENDSWRVFMSLVPKVLPTPEENVQGQTKEALEMLYTSTHIKLIENASKRDPRSPAEIFLFEWSTTGRRRPTVVHFLELLIASNLYRAADYVAMNILQRRAVERPSTGPAAKINLLELDEELEEEEDDDNVNPQVSNVTIENNLDNSKPENTLCGANAPKLLVPPKGRGATGNANTASTARIGQAQNLPEVRITEATASIRLDNLSEVKIENIVLQSPPESAATLSDLMQFSQSQDGDELSSNESYSYDSSESIDTRSNGQVMFSGTPNVSSGDNRPNFSQLLNVESSLTSEVINEGGSMPETHESGSNRPNLSALLCGAVGLTAAPSSVPIVVESCENRPDLSGLLGSQVLESSNSGSLLSQIEIISSESVVLPGPYVFYTQANVCDKQTIESCDDSTSSDDE